jgi:hypothetical protein
VVCFCCLYHIFCYKNRVCVTWAFAEGKQKKKIAIYICISRLRFMLQTYGKN